MPATVTAFLDDRIIAGGEREEVTRFIEDRFAGRDHSSIRVFEDETGKVIDLDYWGAGAAAPQPRGRGRPKLGVTAREVTLLPRQWDWLARQPGGASATLRRLVEEARRSGAAAERERRDAIYRFMQATCGDRPGYEEALRALYRGDMDRFSELTLGWPEDIRSYIAKLLEG